MNKLNDITAVVVRCGRTEWDDQDRLQGRTDLPLSASGREAVSACVRDLIESLTGEPPAVVNCGPDEASVQTAKMLAEPIGARVKSLEGLQGMNLGVWDGLLSSQLMERFPSAYREWKDRPDSVNPPEGETFEDLSHRVLMAACRVLDKANGRPVAFVLRPISYGLIVSWLTGQSTNRIWSILDDGPQAQSLQIPRDRIRTTMEELKAGTR